MDRDRLPISSEVAQVLMDHLLHDGYEVGQRIPSERALSASLGVGRSVIREALKSLALLGLVQVRAGDGNYLQSRSSGLLPNTFEWGMLLESSRIEELIEARRELEVVLVGFAAARRTEADIAELHELLEVMRAAPADQRFVEADVAFHLRIARAAGNSVLQQMLESTHSLLHAWITRVIQAAGDTSTSVAEHIPVLDAIEAGDVEAARAAIRDHLDRAGLRLSAAMAEGSQT
jgi:GntR family transcriptional repressor for pyruvate dehydrogenase complex